MPESIARADAIRILEAAVDSGAPEFNHGNYRKCVSIYVAACNRIIEGAGDEIDPTTVGILELSVQRVRQIKDAQDRAWALRNGIDLAYYALNQRGALAAGGGH